MAGLADNMPNSRCCYSLVTRLGSNALFISNLSCNQLIHYYYIAHHVSIILSFIFVHLKQNPDACDIAKNTGLIYSGFCSWQDHLE